MKIKITSYYLLLFLSIPGLLLLSFKSLKSNPTKWVINNSGYLQVKGSTNVNTFNCVIPNYSHPDTIIIQKNKNSVKLSGEIALSVNAFDCHKTKMTIQLRKTLKASQYPTIKIRFISMEKLPELNSQKESVKGCVEIVLANITKRYKIIYQFSKDTQNTIRLTGLHDVKFSDFKLNPPTKLGGIIKTNDTLGIKFQLQFKEI